MSSEIGVNVNPATINSLDIIASLFALNRNVTSNSSPRFASTSSGHIPVSFAVSLPVTISSPFTTKLSKWWSTGVSITFPVRSMPNIPPIRAASANHSSHAMNLALYF